MIQFFLVNTSIGHSTKGRRQKKVIILGGGGHNFWPKKNHFLFLLPFDAEALKTCKNTIKLINLCALGLGLWFTLTVF